MTAGDGSFDEVTEEVSAIIGTLDPGVYNVCVHGTDVADNTGDQECILLVVFDPEDGFVTGGGWINSPAGAYKPDDTLTGKATFGFVSKYKKGATVPTGKTEFQFKACDLNFHSSDYDWLVVAGAKAIFKGSGTINGEGDYGFMLTAIDGKLNGGRGVDKFRIKIWNKDAGNGVIYDNGVESELQGGSIVIHKK